MAFKQTIISVILLFLLNAWVRRQLSTSSVQYKKYERAVKFILRTLEDRIDYSQHHFQPCRNCGYELALTKDSQYCLKSDVYKILHPSALEEVAIFRDYAGTDMARTMIKREFFDVLPIFEQNRPLPDHIRIQLPLITNVIYPYAKNYFRTHRLGSMAGCLLQKYLHVPGQDEIALKSNQTTHFKNYIKKLKEQKKPEKCIDDAQYYTPTYRLFDYHECTQLFQLINSKNYRENVQRKGIQHIYKNNQHLGRGIMLLDEEGIYTLNQNYQNGQVCGRNMTGAIVQEYITNPYLYNGHKMEFRAYFFIASTDPPILYGYKVALIKQCALAFNLSDTTKQGHVCNTAVTKNIKESKGVKDDEDNLYIDWNLEELQDLLIQQGRVKSKDWLNNFLRPQIFRKVTHLYMSVKDHLFKDSRVGEFFGVDFIMDDNLRLWILECNRNPNFLAVTEGRKDKFGRLIYDLLDLNLRYIQSKYIRLKKYIEEVLLNVTIIDSKQRQEILMLQQDRLEKEFDLPENSLFELVFVLTHNQQDYRYKRYFPEECLLNF